MNTIARLALLIVLSTGAAFSQQAASPDTTGNRVERKLDRMDDKLDEIHDDVRVIRREVVDSPLGKRKWGVEFNPARPLVFAGDALTLSGGVSNFSWDRSAEIAFPFVLWVFGGDDGSVFTQDVHYRHFLGESQRGFYIGGYARYQYAQYKEFDFTNNDTRECSVNRAGLAFELGGRVFSRKGLYWGWSASLGRYFVGDRIDDESFPDNPFLWAGDLILDIELLKVGFAF